jgi:hypothetical protein
VRVVAVTELKGELEEEAAPIAALVGVSAYDVKARLSGALPKLLMQTADRDLAQRVQRALVARGHGALECDSGAAVPSAQMVKLHRFSLDANGIWANDGHGAQLPWADIGVVVVALVRADVMRTTEEVEYQPTVGRTPSKVTHEVIKNEQSLTHAAHLFPRRGAASRTPWLLDEATAQFRSLGASMQPTRRGNFLATLARVRQCAPHAIVDDRFVTYPRTSSVVLHVRGNDPAGPAPAGPGVDLMVHILAEWLMRDRGGPYRG